MDDGLDGADGSDDGVADVGTGVRVRMAAL